MSFEKQFLDIYQKNILRPGCDKLLNYLLSDSSDFFTAPCSTRFHGSYEGGLVEHSVNVYNCLRDYLDRSRVTDVYNMSYSDETVAIAALLHDVCKINFYSVDFRNAKNSRGEWEKVPYYTVDDDLPYGHGEKSVYIISGFMRLSREEAFAIRYHMGFSDTQDKNNVSKAFEKFPLSLALSIADMEATFLLEANSNK